MVKHTLALDWLEFMVSGELVTFDTPLETYSYELDKAGKPRTTLMRKKIGNKHFKFSYEIWRDGRRFATLFCGSRAPEIVAADLINVKIENPLLYEVGTIAACKELFAALNWKVRNITRLDIAMDGVDVIAMGDRFFRGEIDKKGKSRFAAYFTSKRVLEGYDVGKRSSDKWITCYVKSAELEQSNKTYIRDFWKRSGLTSDRVERLELKLRNEAIKMIKDFNWERLDDFEYLASIIRTQAKKIFCFVEKSSDTNISRAKLINWCDWDAVGAKLLETLTARQSDEVYMSKRSCKLLYWYYLASGEQYYLNIARDLALNVNAVEWYIKKKEKWEREFWDKYGHNPDGEIKFKFLSNYRTYGQNEQLKLYEK